MMIKRQKVNTIVFGDCHEKLKDIPNDFFDLIIIDPPYLVTKEKWDRIEQVNAHLVRELLRVAKPHASLYIWCGIGEKSQSMVPWLIEFQKCWKFKDLITWKKDRGIGMRKGWLYTREEIMWFVKDNSKFIWNKKFQCGDERRIRDKGRDIIMPSQNGAKAKSLFKRLSNVWVDISENSFNTSAETKFHYTPKPLKALERIINVHTKPGDRVLDCFAGSGQTGIACINTDRNFYMIEKDPEIYENMTRRFRKLENAPRIEYR